MTMGFYEANSHLDVIAERYGDAMTNPKYTVLVRKYAYGRFCIQITDRTLACDVAPCGHGAIVRELSTYDAFKVHRALNILCNVSDPVDFVKQWGQHLDHQGENHDSSRLA